MKWDSFIESPPLKRIEFASSASPSPMRTVSQTKGHPPPPPQTDGIRSKMVTPYLQEISGLRKNGEFFAYTSGQSNEEHQSRKGSLFPFASRSLEAPGRERPQPPPDHAGDLHEQCPNLDINVEQWLFISSY